ncbi:MAG: recombinase [Clostridia bacterium]|nr:recombinase [Clostridia bacterium]
MADDYEKRVKENEKANEEYLRIFREDLTASGLGEKTIRNHIENVDLLLNDYLPGYEDEFSMQDGMNCMYGFFSFFIRKCLWSTPATVKKQGASLKKFYKCMMEHGFIEKVDYNEFASNLKELLPEFAEECEDYNGGMDYYF